MNAQHTPAPWTLSGPDGVDGNPQFGIRGGNGMWVATIAMHGCTPMLENAAFIVRACNAHDELVAALRELVAIDEWMILVGGTEGPISQSHIEEAARRRLPAIDSARAALAKAGAA